eukprot:4787740-Amphidinium_carterae.1
MRARRRRLAQPSWYWCQQPRSLHPQHHSVLLQLEQWSPIAYNHGSPNASLSSPHKRTKSTVQINEVLNKDTSLKMPTLMN